MKKLKKEINKTCLFFIKTDINIYSKITPETMEVCKVQNFKIPKQYLKFINENKEKTK